MIKRRSYITLIELLLVIAILGIVAGIVGVNATKAWQEQRFKSEVAQVVDQLRLAQDLMLIFNTNVQFKIAATDDGLEYRLEFDTPLPQRWSAEINRPHNKLQVVRAFNFEDKLESEDNLKSPPQDNSTNIVFLSGGSRMSRGIIRISTTDDFDRKDALTRYICLPGVPAPISSTAVLPSPNECTPFTPEFINRLTDENAHDLEVEGL